MKTISALFSITEQYFKIKNTKLARKYLDRVLYLKGEYYEESNKAENIRNHALMDNIINELCQLAETGANTKK
ncbi:MAG: hypothetical protein ACI9IA_000221 [Enterobacterales bacterium]|jgi:hypothetical protein